MPDANNNLSWRRAIKSAIADRKQFHVKRKVIGIQDGEDGSWTYSVKCQTRCAVCDTRNYDAAPNWS